MNGASKKMPWSRNTLWRQGSVLLQKDFHTANLNDSSDAELVVAISHDCDIANDNLEAEPTVEFIFGRIIQKLDGNYTHGKNPRILHLSYMNAGYPISIELVASRRVMVQKKDLEAVQPDQTYELLGSRQVLQSWLAARYRRHALPNSLVERLREVSKYIQEKGKKNSSGILAFRLRYDPEDELPPEEPYELWLSVVYINDMDEYGSIAEKIASDLMSKFPSLLDKTKAHGKVDLRYCKAVSAMEFTLQDMRDTEEYHLEHLSYRTEPPGPII
jgi:hypothetical protein